MQQATSKMANDDPSTPSMPVTHRRHGLHPLKRCSRRQIASRRHAPVVNHLQQRVSASTACGTLQHWLCRLRRCASLTGHTEQKLHGRLFKGLLQAQCRDIGKATRASLVSRVLAWSLNLVHSHSAAGVSLVLHSHLAVQPVPR
jgi:hypothetical protein